MISLCCLYANHPDFDRFLLRFERAQAGDDPSGKVIAAYHGADWYAGERYAGPRASDEDRVNYLLSKMAGVPWEKRTARFVCVIAVATPHREVKLCSGICDGYIAFKAKGTNGFGYDPVFYFPELDRTMAELTPQQKNGVSHRGRAAQEARKLLRYISP